MSMLDDDFPNGRCCVFQPFDNGGDFDKRFDDTLAPAIRDAQMEPYRVDRDLGSVIPVETLHQEIRSSVICLADITTRNPNVMYELGYAIAAEKDVVIISAPSPEKYPFDIAHRGIIPYTTGSMTVLTKLRSDLTAKLKAMLILQKKTTSIADVSPLRSSDGLEQHEFTALALIGAHSDSNEDVVGASWLKQEMKKNGYTDIGTRMAFSRLTRLNYVLADFRQDGHDQYVVYSLTEAGEDWLLSNQSKLKMTVDRPTSKPDYGDGISDDDIPF